MQQWVQHWKPRSLGLPPRVLLLVPWRGAVFVSPAAVIGLQNTARIFVHFRIVAMRGSWLLHKAPRRSRGRFKFPFVIHWPERRVYAFSIFSLVYDCAAAAILVFGANLLWIKHIQFLCSELFRGSTNYTSMFHYSLWHAIKSFLEEDKSVFILYEQYQG